MNAVLGTYRSAAPLLSGSFAAVPLSRVFSVLALSRQLIGVHFADERGDVGVITVKAGRVIGAEDFRTPSSGTEALRDLLRDPGTTFSMSKLPNEALAAQSATVIGSFADVLAAAGSELDHQEAHPEPPATPPERAAEVPAAGGVPHRDARTAHPERSPPADGSWWPDAPAPLASPTSHSTDDDTPYGIFDGDGTRPLGEMSSPEHRALTEPDGAHTGKARAPEAAVDSATDVILHGYLGDIGFEEILEVLQLNPNPLLISFTRGGNEIGTLGLLSQQVTGASAGQLRGKEAFVELFANPGDAFEVRGAPRTEATRPLGSISQLLIEAREASTAAPGQQNRVSSARSPFMEGRFADFSLELLLSSLNLSRQPIELEFRRDGVTLHRVLLKSGQIVSAESARTAGDVAALAAIRADPGVEFTVYRRGELADRSILAPLQALLSDARAAPDPGGAAVRPDFVPRADPIMHPRSRTDARPDGGPGIQEPPEHIAASVPRMPETLEASQLMGGEPAEARQASSQFAATAATLIANLEESHRDALQELREALQPRERERERERMVLWSVLALQFVCLAGVGVLLAIVAL